MEGKGTDGEDRGKIPKMGARCRKRNVRIHGKGGVAKGEAKDESGKEGIGFRKEIGRGKGK